MNRIFKKVFNKKTGEYTVASETAKGNKKSTCGAKTALVLAVSLVSMNSMAVSLGYGADYSGINGATIGKGTAFNPQSYNYDRQGWSVGNNQQYYNSNAIGTNELNSFEQRQAGLLQGTIDNYSQNIGQANHVNKLLTYMQAASYNPEPTNLFDMYINYYVNSSPYYMNNFESMPLGYDEMFDQFKSSAINDALNQKLITNDFNYYSPNQSLPNSAKVFGGNNNHQTLQNYGNGASSNLNSVMIGRDNSFYADAKDSTIIGHNNSVDVVANSVHSNSFYSETFEYKQIEEVNPITELPSTSNCGYDSGYVSGNFDPIPEPVAPDYGSGYVEIPLPEVPETPVVEEPIVSIPPLANPVPNAAFKETSYFTHIVESYSNAYAAGAQSTVIGNNTVNYGVNNITIGSNTADRTTEALQLRQQYLNDIEAITERYSTDAEKIYQLETPQEFANAAATNSHTYRKEYTKLLNEYMSKATALSTGITANDSVLIGVNASVVNDENAWWLQAYNHLIALDDEFSASAYYDQDYDLISVDNPALEHLYKGNVEIWEPMGGIQFQDRKTHNQLAVGYGASSNHTNSVAIGTNAKTTEEDSIDFGFNRVTNVDMAISDSDAMTVGNLKALEGEFNYKELIYDPYRSKVKSRNHVQADVVARSIEYGKQKDIIMNNELTAYLKDKTDQFVTATVDTNSQEIERLVTSYTANEISKGKIVIDSTIEDINKIYANTKDKFELQAQDKLADNLNDFTKNANESLKLTGELAVNDSIGAFEDANNSITLDLAKANDKLNAELDVIADYEDEATDKKILAELIGKTAGKTFGDDNGSTGGDGGSQNSNGLTDAFEDAYKHLTDQDKVTHDQLVAGFNDALDKANEDFDKNLDDLNIQDKLLSNKDSIQDKAYQDGLNLIDAKDKATQLQVLNNAYELAKQTSNDLVNQTQTLNNNIEVNIVNAANKKDAEIAQQLVNTASEKDKEILSEVSKIADEADLANSNAVKAEVDKADAKVLANITDYSNLLNKSTQNGAEAYASEQDKLVYNRMLEVLSSAPSSSMANVWKNINEGDQAVFDQSLDYIDSKDAENLAKAKDYADLKAQSIEKSFNSQTKRLEAGVASAVAASMLGQSSVPGAHTIGASVGIYGKEVGYAFGASTMTSDSSTVLKAGFTLNSKNRVGFMSGAGFYIK